VGEAKFKQYVKPFLRFSAELGEEKRRSPNNNAVFCACWQGGLTDIAAAWYTKIRN
jgi:hypothetical protein